MNTFLRTPWVASEPLDSATVKDVVPRQIQIAFVDDAVTGVKQLVPLTPAATELLNGTNRDRARTFFNGVIKSAQENGAHANLRGMSLATDDAGFATNLMMSNVESGYVPDSISSNEPAKFKETFQAVANDAVSARAQNTGWLDVGPKVSREITGLIEHGADQIAHHDLDEISVVLSHELQHAATPPTTSLPEKYVWLEEGTAETLAWWPTVARSTLNNIAIPPSSWRDPDPFTVDEDALPSPKYRNQKQAVQGLLSLAGVEPYDESGAVAHGALLQARTLLQTDRSDRAPRNLARAIAKRAGADSSIVEPLAKRIVEIDGDPQKLSELEAWIATTVKR